MDDGGAEPGARAGWVPAADLAWTGSADRVALLRLGEPGEAPVILEGSAAVIWTALVAGPPEGVVDACVDLGLDADVVCSFLGELEEADLAQRR